MTLLLNTPFNPASVGSLYAWYDATTITGLTNGASATTWNDLSGNGYTLTAQIANGDAITYATSAINGLPALFWDGLTKNAMASGTTPTINGTNTIFAAVIPQGTDGAFGEIITPEDTDRFLGVNNGGSWELHGVAAAMNPAYSSGSPAVVSCGTGTNAFITINGSTTSETATTIWPSPSGTHLMVGASGNGNYGWQGYIGEVLFYTAALTAPQIASIQAYLTYKWLGTGTNPSTSSTAGPIFLPRKLGPKAVGPTYFASQLAKLIPSPPNVFPPSAVARASVPHGATLTAGASITARTAIARARVSAGITAGTPAPAPVVTTGTAVAVPSGQETLNGTANPETGATTAFFQWGTTTAYGNQTTSQSIGSGAAPVAFSATISGLTNGVQYHYRAAATNSGGTTFGPDATFYGFNPPAPTTGLVKTWQNQNPFTYCFYDLLSGKFLGTLPLTQVTFGSQLLQPGSFSGTIDTASAAVQNLGVFDLIQPARTAILIDYLGSFIWGGIIWTAPYEQDDTKRQVQISATEIWSYFANQREQATDYSSPPYSGITGTGSYMPIWDASATSVPEGGPGTYDPLLIAWQMLSDATYHVPNSNLFGGTGIAANGYTTASAYLASGTNTPLADYLSESYPYSSLQQLGSALNQLATLGLGIGFDYAVDVGGSATGTVTCTINLSYPRRGRAFSQSNLVLDCQRALKFSIPSDGTQTANTVYEQGANGALSVSQNLQPLNGGYPILERVMSRSNIQSANVMQVLQQCGAADLAIYSYPVYTPTVTTDLFTGPLQLGQFIVGDDVYWRIPKTDGVGNTFCSRFPQGLNVEARVIAYQATVADAGTSTLDVTLAEPPSFTVTGPWF